MVLRADFGFDGSGRRVRLHRHQPCESALLDSCNQRIVSAISTRRNSHCCSGQETHARPTEFPPGMDSRCDCHNGMFVASVAMFVV